MKGKISAIEDKIAAMFAMLATTGASLPGSDIRPRAIFFGGDGTGNAVR